MLVDQLVTPLPVEGATGGGLIAAGGVVRTVLDRPTLVLSYLWQTFLPPLPFMTDLFTGSSLPVMDTYVREGFASFGWYTMEFAPWVYRGIAVALLALGASAARRGVALPRMARGATCRSSRSWCCRSPASSAA